MEQLLARKIEAAAAASGGSGSGNAAGAGAGAAAPAAGGTSNASTLSTQLATPLTAAAIAIGGSSPAAIVSRLRRTDSLDSTSSLGSLAFGEDVCRCDDCLLGIVDLYVISAAEAAKKKVGVRLGRLSGWGGECTLSLPLLVKSQCAKASRVVRNLTKSIGALQARAAVGESFAVAVAVAAEATLCCALAKSRRCKKLLWKLLDCWTGPKLPLTSQTGGRAL